MHAGAGAGAGAMIGTGAPVIAGSSVVERELLAVPLILGPGLYPRIPPDQTRRDRAVKGVKWLLRARCAPPGTN